MKNFVKIMLTVALVFVMTGSANAWFLDFEWGLGLDGQPIASGVPGVQFTTTDGFDWHYGDITTDGYNTYSDNGYGSGGYAMGGNVFAWLGTSQGSGRIDFLNQDATWFQTGYTANSNFYVEAYDVFDNMIDQAVGGNNYGYGIGMNYLTVTSASPNIAYVLVHDGGNYFLLDNMSGDASGVTSPGIPEPATMLLFGAGLMGLGAKLRRKK